MPIDYSKYPPDWAEIRARILKRAGELRDDAGNIIKEACCEHCGIENHSLYRTKDLSRKPLKKVNSMTAVLENGNFCRVGQGISRIVLTIAHLDHDEKNWAVSDERLRALCQKDHLQYDVLEKQRRKTTASDRNKYRNSLFPEP
jgi:hypothetical protein